MRLRFSDLDGRQHCAAYIRRSSGHARKLSLEESSGRDDLTPLERYTAIVECCRLTALGQPLPAIKDDWRACVDYFVDSVLPEVYRSLPMACIDDGGQVIDPAGIVEPYQPAMMFRQDVQRLAVILHTGYSERELPRDRPSIKYMSRCIDGPVLVAELDRASKEVVRSGEVPGNAQAIDPGEQCRRCRFAVGCPHLFRATDGFENGPPVDDLGTADIVKELDRMPMVKARIKAIEDRATELAQADACGPYRLVSGRSSRAWVSDQHATEAIARLSTVLGRPVRPFRKPEVRSITDIEREVGKSKKVVAAIDGAIKRVPGKPKLKKEEP